MRADTQLCLCGLPPGTLLRQRFIVDRLLVATHMSTIYLGRERRHQAPARLVIIKRLSTAAMPGGLPRATSIRAFRREGQLLAALNHPQIPRVLAAFRDEDDYYLVMEYIDGITLDVLMARGPISPATAIAIIDELCAVIHYLHRFQPAIIHADIKPSNIMITSDGGVVLLDFGLARLCEPRRWDDPAVGTLPFAPPEQRQGEPLDQRSDLYALAVLVGELLGDSEDSELQAVLRRAQALRPGERFASVRQFQRALHRQPDLAAWLRRWLEAILAGLWLACIVIIMAALLIMLLYARLT